MPVCSESDNICKPVDIDEPFVSLLIRAWQEMASGNAVDEQRVERWPFLTGKLPEKYAQAGVSENCLDSAVPDEEVDVNDALLAMTNRSSVRPGPYEDDEDGEEYYDF